MILVVSSPTDAHATAVLSRLAARGGEARLLDLSRYPRDGRLTIELNGHGSMRRRMALGDEQTDLGDCRVVWWRRPQPYGIADEIEEGADRNFAYSECHAAFSGLWLTLDPLWINHPTKDDEAAHKVYQLQVARELGFETPDTCITSDPEVARAFVAKHGNEQVIYKAFSGTLEAWRETRILKDHEVELIDGVRYAPVIFQRYVPAEADLRITVIGDRVFPCAIDCRDTEYQCDFRMVMGQARMTAETLPPDLEERLVAYVRRLGLVYGAIDMRRTPDGEYVFLEINPSGQWLFCEERTGLPITEAMCERMMREDRGA